MLLPEEEVPDKNQRMKKLFDLIEKGLTQTSVTSVSSSDATTIRPKKGDNKRVQGKRNSRIGMTENFKVTKLIYQTGARKLSNLL